MDQVKFVEDSLYKTWSDMVCLGRTYHFKFFKGCLPQILLGPFLNTLTDMQLVFQCYFKYTIVKILEVSNNVIWANIRQSITNHSVLLFWNTKTFIIIFPEIARKTWRRLASYDSKNKGTIPKNCFLL